MRIEEYDDGYTRESFERADEDTPETIDPQPKRRDPPDDMRCCNYPLTLARDKTTFSRLTRRSDEWIETDLGTDLLEDADSTRLFCGHCGEYFNLPEGIE